MRDVRVLLDQSNKGWITERYANITRQFEALMPAVPRLPRPAKPGVGKKGWTAEEDDLLVSLYDEPITLDEIGLRLGVDRWAVITRAKRLGLPGRREQRQRKRSRQN